jgi:hypothetical protein
MPEANPEQQQIKAILTQPNDRLSEWQRPALSRLAASAAETAADDKLHDTKAALS